MAKTATKTEDIPVQEAPAEAPIDWKIPIHAEEILFRISKELNKSGREVLWLTYARGAYESPLIRAFEVTLEHGVPVQQIEIVKRGIELGVVDLARESPQVPGETLP
jgi:hypothetical protein